MRTHFKGDTLFIVDDNGDTLTVQLTPLTDIETGAIVWRDNTIIGGLWRTENDSCTPSSTT